MTPGRFGRPLRHAATLVVAALAMVSQTAQAAVEGCVGCAKAAVLDMDSVQSCQSFSGEWGGVINCNYGWQSFQAMLETAIASSRKMQIVERKQLGRMLDEQALQSKFRYGDKKIELTTTAADYLVYGNITEIGYERREYNARGGANRNVVGTFAVDVKFAETRTGKIFYSGTIRVEETMSASSSSTDGSTSNSASPGALYGQLQRKAARAIAQQLVTAAFPIRVLQVSGSSVVLSYGSGVLEKGMVLEVADASGGDLIDPDTGRRLFGVGVSVAKLVVTGTNPDYSTARLLSGSIDDVSTNARITISDEVEAVAAPMTGGAWPGG